MPIWPAAGSMQFRAPDQRRQRPRGFRRHDPIPPRRGDEGRAGAALPDQPATPRSAIRRGPACWRHTTRPGTRAPPARPAARRRSANPPAQRTVSRARWPGPSRAKPRYLSATPQGSSNANSTCSRSIGRVSLNASAGSSSGSMSAACIATCRVGRMEIPGRRQQRQRAHQVRPPLRRRDRQRATHAVAGQHRGPGPAAAIARSSRPAT